MKRGTNVKHRPSVFTEQGVAMLSSVLRSKQSVQVNIEVMRAFVRLRGLLRLGNNAKDERVATAAVAAAGTSIPAGKK